jgi:hypothetical protein
VKEEAEATRIRTARKQANLKKARAQANKMASYDSAMETTYANSQEELEMEIISYGNAKGHLLNYLQEKFKGWNKLLRRGIYNPIPTLSKFCSLTKPYKLRMFPPKTLNVNTRSHCVLTGIVDYHDS